MSSHDLFSVSGSSPTPKKRTAIPKANFRIEHHGSVCLIVPLCSSARDWLDKTHRQRRRVSTLLPDRRNRTPLPASDHRGHSARWAGGAMSRKNEEAQGTSSVSFRVPDFVGEVRVEYTEIEVIVQMADIQDAAKLVDALQRPLTDRQ